MVVGSGVRIEGRWGWNRGPRYRTCIASIVRRRAVVISKKMLSDFVVDVCDVRIRRATLPMFVALLWTGLPRLCNLYSVSSASSAHQETTSPDPLKKSSNCRAGSRLTPTIVLIVRCIQREKAGEDNVSGFEGL